MPTPAAAPVNTTHLLNALSARHIGRERGISAKLLAYELNVTERRLRHLVSEAREAGIPLCGRPEDGYFIARTAEELQETCAFLEHRALHSLRALSRMRRLSMPELLGQLKLNQA
jgi:predicted DNA-binding transcriptional regulator YafY